MLSGTPAAATDGARHISYDTAGLLPALQASPLSSAMPSRQEGRSPDEASQSPLFDWLEMALRALAALAAITLIGGLRRR